MKRLEEVLNHRWRFAPDPENTGITGGWPEKGIPCFREVFLPHTWNTEDGLENYYGAAWYEYPFEAPKNWAGKRVRICFNGVYRDADFWMNGRRLGRHYGSGFTAFQIDAGDAIRAGQDNTLTVRVDNSFMKDALPSEDHFDWADDGGIYRKAKFVVTERESIEFAQISAKPILSGNSRQTAADAAWSAKVVLAEGTQGCQCAAEVFEGYGANQKSVYRSSDVNQTEHGIDFHTVTLPQVNLWHFDAPNLYTAVFTLTKDGKVTDTLETRFGFREFHAEGAGFVLNGESVRLPGTEWMPGSHPAFGNAEPDEVLYQFLTLLKESNAIFTRFHWQQDEAVYDWCDENGILVQEEVPNWGSPKEPGPLEMDISKRQYREMIQSHCNHPSIVAWGMGNELNGQSAVTKTYMKELKSYFKALDADRMVSYVSNTMFQGADADATGVSDMLMVNEYIGTWHGNLDEAEELRKIFEAYPNKPLVISESGLCEPTFAGGDPGRIRQFIRKMEIYRRFDNLAGLVNFCLNDYRTQMGEEGKGRLRRRIHGSTDVFGEPKPSYSVVQEFHAPLEVTGMTDGSVTLRCKNSLPSYSASGYRLQTLDAACRMRETAEIPDCAPGETVTIMIATAGAAILRVIRPTGFKVLEISTADC